MLLTRGEESPNTQKVETNGLWTLFGAKGQCHRDEDYCIFWEINFLRIYKKGATWRLDASSMHTPTQAICWIVEG